MFLSLHYRSGSRQISAPRAISSRSVQPSILHTNRRRSRRPGGRLASGARGTSLPWTQADTLIWKTTCRRGRLTTASTTTDLIRRWVICTYSGAAVLAVVSCLLWFCLQCALCIFDFHRKPGATQTCKAASTTSRPSSVTWRTN